MRRAVVLILATCVVGCRADPETGRLAAGSTAVVAVHEDGEDLYTDIEGGLAPFGVGTQVTILDDSDTDLKGFDRFVRVAIANGPAAGKTATVHRKILRPVAR